MQKQLEACLKTGPMFPKIKPVYTNIIIFDLIPSLSTDSFINRLINTAFHASAFGKIKFALCQRIWTSVNP